MTSGRNGQLLVRSVTVTGPRSIEQLPPDVLPNVFDAFLRPFANQDARFYLGGAVGIDTAALEWLAVNSQAAMTVVVPCALADQPALAVDAVSRWRRRGRVDDVVELGATRLGTEAYHARNRWMVDRSHLVVGFPHGTEPSSGTWYTLSYAADQAKPRLIVPV